MAAVEVDELVTLATARERLGVPLPTLRRWASEDGWAARGSVSGTGGRPAQLFGWVDVEGSAKRRGREPRPVPPPAPPAPPLVLPAEFGDAQPDAAGLIVCPRCRDRVPLAVALGHVLGVRSGVLRPLDRDPRVPDRGDEPWLDPRDPATYWNRVQW